MRFEHKQFLDLGRNFALEEKCEKKRKETACMRDAEKKRKKLQEDTKEERKKKKKYTKRCKN